MQGGLRCHAIATRLASSSISPARNFRRLLPSTVQFLNELRQAGFEGDASAAVSTSATFSTDNSIYQCPPQAVLFPANERDVLRITRLAAKPQFADAVSITARGGGTACNGQSLANGIVVDLSRRMNRIISISPDKRQAKIQSGVVKDQLNAAVRKHGLFFAPECSTSSRATLGGMIGTDAAGQGSLRYGKTRDHTVAVNVAMIGGYLLKAHDRMDFRELEAVAQAGGTSGAFVNAAVDIAASHRQTVEQAFPPLTRAMTGYDLPGLWRGLESESGGLNLKALFCGAEGTLGIVTEAVLKLEPIPRNAAVIAIRYPKFSSCLDDAHFLMYGSTDSTVKSTSWSTPTSIECMDGLAFSKAKSDICWSSVARYFPGESVPCGGLNLIEFLDSDPDRLRAKITAFVAAVEADNSIPRERPAVAWTEEERAAVWNMRKRTVGLLGAVEGRKRPWPFIEDTAVPPQRLAAYVTELRELLDSQKFDYGMFGHVDAGVLHVRPLIDLAEAGMPERVRQLSRQVNDLARRYGGVMWGEHGRGMRSEFLPDFWGPEVYPLIQQLKQAADPHYQLNPGKVAAPPHGKLLRVDGLPLRGSRPLPDDLVAWGGNASHCNGNAACFNWQPDDPMCPSWKATRDRRWSPKGRATVWREWAIVETLKGRDLLDERRSALDQTFIGRILTSPSRIARTMIAGSSKLTLDLYESFSRCLGCRACANQCPLQIDVPTLKAEFLNVHHAKYARPAKDVLVASLEPLLPVVARMRLLWNAALPLANIFTQHVFGLQDLPKLSKKTFLKRWPIASAQALQRLSEADRAKTVVIVQDCFTTFFDSEVVNATAEVLTALGLRVFLSKVQTNGKPLHVLGMLNRFSRAATKQSAYLKSLDIGKVHFVGIDPAMTLVYRHEYPQTANQQHHPRIQLLQEFLLSHPPPEALRKSLKKNAAKMPQTQLLLHCTEQTALPESANLWRSVLQAWGLTSLDVSAVGCCGMSGLFGHESKNVAISKRCYDLSWKPKVDGVEEDGKAAERVTFDYYPSAGSGSRSGADAKPLTLATGYSCRSQTRRFSPLSSVKHPVQLLQWCIRP